MLAAPPPQSFHLFPPNCLSAKFVCLSSYFCFAFCDRDFPQMSGNSWTSAHLHVRRGKSLSSLSVTC